MIALPENLNNELEKAARAIRAGRDFFIAVHRNPDGDCLGCALAMASVLGRLGKTCFLYSVSPIPENLGFLPGIDRFTADAGVPSGRQFDTALMMECSAPARAGAVEGILAATENTINLDHHSTFEPYGTVNAVAPGLSSVSELAGRLQTVLLGLPFTREEADCYYTGVVTDTGRFQYPSTTASTHRFAAELIDAGADFARINRLVYGVKAYPAVKLLGRALEKLYLADGGRTAVSVLALEDFEDCAARSQHTEEIVNYGVMIPGVRVSVLFREEPGRITVNFRSSGEVDVSAIAGEFGGGGHRAAAGCKHSGATLDELMGRILPAIAARYGRE
ncbi:MAG: DHH family phosphoesterase [Elusimicrobiaceae bacterium]|nr:DHH family phosphoesterase [Elusimicrobiaceae bacterium]